MEYFPSYWVQSLDYFGEVLFPVYGSDDWFCVFLNFCNYIVPFFHISNIVHVRCSFEICSVRLLYRNVVVSCKCSLIGWLVVCRVLVGLRFVVVVCLSML